MTDKKTYLFKRLVNRFMIIALLLVISCGPAWSQEEAPLSLPKAEGSKSFDLKIDQSNSQGIQLYRQGNYQKAVAHFKKALNLAKQLRDPSQGIMYYNLALSLHKIGQHEESAKQFYSARRFARGNPTILKSKLLEMHECGLNPSVPCNKKAPFEMNIEGSH